MRKIRAGIRRILPVILTAALVFSFTSTALAAPDEAGESVEGNLILVRTQEEFEKGELTNVEVSTSDVSDGAIRLTAGQADGEYVSQIFEVEPFEYMVASWNAQVPDGTSIEIKARAYADMADSWTDWLSWGTWTRDIAKRGSANDETDLAGVDTDVFTIYGSDGQTASRVQLKAELHTEDTAVTPVVEQVAVTYRNTLEGQAITPTLTESLYDGTLPEKVEPTAPAISQMVREPNFGNVMCSATTICTLLNAHGEDLLPEQVALLCYDSVYEGFGNWAFSTSTAGAFGYEAYVQYADFDVLRNEIANGNPVGISVRYSDTPDGNYPYVEGAPTSTSGHLICITGYETVDGVDYFYSSDPAAGSDAGCLRRYRADQLDEAWSGRVAYIIHDKQDPSVTPIETIETNLVPVEGEENMYTLDTDQIAFNAAFRSGQLRTKGGGAVAYTIDGQDAVADADTLPVVLKANHMFKYTLLPDKDGKLNLSPNRVMASANPGDTWTVRFYIMTNDGKYAETSVELTKPAEGEEAAPPADSTEPPADTADSSEGGVNGVVIGVICAIAALVVVLLIVIFLRRKKSSAPPDDKA